MLFALVEPEERDDHDLFVEGLLMSPGSENYKLPPAFFAQTPDPAAGKLPLASQTGAPYDSVDLATSNISVTIPVRSKNEKIPFSSALYGNTHAYT
jgi:hypothetical protein